MRGVSGDPTMAAMDTEAPMETDLHLTLLADHPEDLPAVARWQYGEWGYLDEGDSVARREERLRGHLHRDRLPLTVVARLDAGSGGRLVGSADLVETELPEHVDLSPWLSAVYVDEAHRGQGVGTALTRFATDKAAELGHRPLYLCTWNRRGFYERLGWEVVRSFRSRGAEVFVMRF